MKARFIEPMLLLRTDGLPADASRWEYQLKLDGYRAVAFKASGKLHLRSRNDNDFSLRYPGVMKGLAKLPNETVIDGEVIALDEDGKPSFNVLQNHASAASVLYFVFEVMVLGGRDLRRETLETDKASKPPARKPVADRVRRPASHDGGVDYAALDIRCPD